MTRDYRQTSFARPTPRRKQGRFCLWSFILGVMIGAFGVGVYWTQNPDALSSAPVAVVPPKVERPPSESLSFEFPHLLSEAEVDISSGPPPPAPAPRPEPPPPQAAPPQTAVPAVPTAPPPPAPTSTDGKGYVVQVASFKRGSDAERLKAELALLGISTRVEVATLANGSTVHRVRTGPYADKRAADEVQSYLKQHGKDSMALPVR